MDMVDVIYTRRSARRFLGKPVEKTKIEQMIAAAVQAPCAMGSQPWAFAVVQDPDTLKSISDAAKLYLLSILDRAPMLEKYREHFENPEFSIFYNAPTLVLICSKPDLSPEPRTDCALAAGNLMLMARNLGLGTCWIGFAYGYLNTPEAKQAHGIPEACSVQAPIIVGYPEAEFARAEKNAPEILFWK